MSVEKAGSEDPKPLIEAGKFLILFRVLSSWMMVWGVYGLFSPHHLPLGDNPRLSSSLDFKVSPVFAHNETLL